MKKCSKISRIKRKSSKILKIFLKRELEKSLHKIVSAKNEKTVIDKNEEGLSQIEKIIYGKINCDVCGKILRI